MTAIELGSGATRRREETFAKGAIVVRSPRGVRAAERGLLDALPRDRSGAALAINSAEAVAGLALRALNPELAVHCHYDDAWDLDRAQETAARHADLAVELAVAADPPDGPWDLVALAVERDDPTDLLRERLRQAVGWLRPGGLLLASTSNPRDRFLREQVKAVFGPPTIVPGRTRSRGVTYIARRPKVAGRLRAPGPRTFTVLEGDRELAFTSRPGIFCHGKLDPVTRALLEQLDVGEAKRILDLGCGVGAIGVVAALRAPGAHVTMMDSYARSVECARANAEAAGVAGRCEVTLTPDTLRDAAPGCDLVVTNPPYYGHYRISEMFLATAERVLEPGGRLCLATKGVEWHAAKMAALFGSVERVDIGGYAVLTATPRR